MTTEFDVLHKSISNSQTIDELNAVHRVVRMVQMAGHLTGDEMMRLGLEYNKQYKGLTS